MVGGDEQHPGDPVLVIEGQAPVGLDALLARFGFSRTRLAQTERMPVDGRHNSKIDRPALREALRKGRLPLKEPIP